MDERTDREARQAMQVAVAMIVGLFILMVVAQCR